MEVITRVLTVFAMVRFYQKIICFFEVYGMIFFQFSNFIPKRQRLFSRPFLELLLNMSKDIGVVKNIVTIGAGLVRF